MNRYYQVPAEMLAVGMQIDDERFAHVMRVGHVAIGRKWVSARSFHPDANISPNAPYCILIGDTVRVLRSTLPVDYFGARAP